VTPGIFIPHTRETCAETPIFITPHASDSEEDIYRHSSFFLVVIGEIRKCARKQSPRTSFILHPDENRYCGFPKEKAGRGTLADSFTLYNHFQQQRRHSAGVWKILDAW
jgi:hypothetical protein